MERHQRIQLKTISRSTNQPFQVSPFQTRGFGVQQKAASTPASKAELWENYQRSSQMTQQGAGRTRSAIQTKLSIGQPGDKYEQEADSVADRVMAMSEPAQVQCEELAEEEELQMKPLAGTISPLVQREELPEEEEELRMKPEDRAIQREALPEEEEELQMKSLDNSIQREELPEEEELQMKESPTPNSQLPTDSLEDRLSSSKGGGSPLSDDVRSFMEPRFGADFSGVRVHTGSDAVQMNQDVNAQAFAYGQDVYFGAGKAPGKDSLTAHELTHVLQQAGGAHRKCEVCESAVKEEKESLKIQPKLNTNLTKNSIHQDNYIQRVHLDENKRKKFDSPNYAGDSNLEACLNDEDRLRPLETGSSVISVQQGLKKDGADLGKDGTAGTYGADTGKAVMAFKRKYHLGFEEFPDVGPETMKKLDELNLPKHQEKPSQKPHGKLPVPAPTLPPKIKFWLNSFIPNTLSGVRPAPGGPFAGRQVFPSPPHPFHRNSCFETDDRSFSSAPGASSRVGIEAEIDTVSEDITFTPKADITFEIDCNTGVVKCKSMPSPSVTAFKLPNPLKALGHSNNLNYFISGSGNDPCVTGSPNLAFRGVVSIDRTARTLSFQGTTTIFPAFEMYASSGSSTVTIFTRSPSGNSPLLLLVPGISPVSGVVSI